MFVTDDPIDPEIQQIAQRVFDAARAGEADTLAGYLDAGVPVKDICRQAGISVATYYQWKSKYGGMEASDLRRVKELEAENAKLKRMYAEQALDIAAMKELIAKKL